MKRSEINAIMRAADVFIRKSGFMLPPFAYWTPDDWRMRGPECAEIVTNRLGWDVTDFGLGDFARSGLFLFTIRNGNLCDPAGKPYAEKLLIVDEGQLTPLHFHWKKMEDIINRGGGTLAVRLYAATPDEQCDALHPVEVSLDGVRCTIGPGGVVRLRPGESITLPPYLYHEFWGEGGRVLVGEVSSVNDDTTDNRFYQPVGRFPAIEEDEPPRYLLCNDYERYYQTQV
ncbi:MAG: D-lyxose/D-mannose family sugar isomerase [Chloroflexi bacterium]|nr:D-lyxose/D-mannose family sugar isomerase [Chloroflexota bacterium]